MEATQGIKEAGFAGLRDRMSWRKMEKEKSEMACRVGRELGKSGERLWKKYRRGKCFIRGGVELMSSGLGIPFS